MSLTYMTTTELALKIKYKPKTIRETLVDKVLFEGRHYIRPFGQRRLLFLWEHIEQDIKGLNDHIEIPMANGGVCYG